MGTVRAEDHVDSMEGMYNIILIINWYCRTCKLVHMHPILPLLGSIGEFPDWGIPLSFCFLAGESKNKSNKLPWFLLFRILTKFVDKKHSLFSFSLKIYEKSLKSLKFLKFRKIDSDLSVPFL